jgi:5'-deoxynucleotidase
MIPSELRPAYAPLLMEPSDDVLPWLKAADRLDAYLKCSIEVMAGNREFSVAKAQCAASLAAMEMEEVAAFLDTFAGAFEQTLDEISQPIGSGFEAAADIGAKPATEDA